MADGTALPRFKRAFIAELKTLGIENVSYQSPMQPQEIMGGDGEGLSCWFEDAANGTLSIEVLAGPALTIDETWQIPFRIQALGTDTDSDQEALDQAACELLGDVLKAFGDQSFGLVDDATIEFFDAVPVGAQPWYGGVLPTNLRACRYELTIEMTAHINIPAI